MKNIAGKVVLITGGAMGIGRGLARHFLKDGARLVLVDINRGELERAAAEMRKDGGEVHTYLCDVSRRDNVYSMAGRVKKDVGPVDVLVNNAGVLFGGDFLALHDDHLQKTIDINLMAYMWMMKAFLPDMAAKNEGHVINIASAAGLFSIPGLSVYSASKHAVVGLTDAVRMEMKKKGKSGVRFTTICPSFINTALVTGVTMPKRERLLSVGEITDKIYAAVKRDAIILKEPFTVRLASVLKVFIPPSLFDRMVEKLGWFTTMDTWKGHNG